MADLRFGIDFGGTKIEIIALGPDGTERLRRRIPTPPDYAAALDALSGLVTNAEAELGATASVGIGIPGAISPETGRVRNANTLYLNDKPLDTDLGTRLGREVRVENDANCFALSEAMDGAGEGFGTVFGVILGTGCGGAIVANGKLLPGRHRIAGEWGHVPLPWPEPEDLPYPDCFCGNRGCIERYVAGPALAASYWGQGARDASALPALAASGDLAATRALRQHAERLARGFALLINILDPDAIVIGGGLSNLGHLYEEVPKLLKRHVIADAPATPILRARHGDSSGVRGAAWLWGR